MSDLLLYETENPPKLDWSVYYRDAWGYSEIETAAEDYAARGFYIFPLAAQSKLPIKGSSSYKDGKPDATPWHTKQTRNIGLWCKDLVVIDVDVKNGKNGLPYVEKHRSLFYDPTVPRAKTPSGGYHFFFLKPADLPLTSHTNLLAEGIDIKSDGGYVLLYPSTTPKGMYVWEQQGDPAPLPKELEDEIRNAMETKHRKKIERTYYEWVSAEELIKSGDRFEYLRDHAYFARSVGADEEQIYAYVQLLYDVRCEHCGGDKEVARDMAAYAARSEPFHKLEDWRKDVEALCVQRWEDASIAWGLSLMEAGGATIEEGALLARVYGVEREDWTTIWSDFVGWRERVWADVEKLGG